MSQQTLGLRSLIVCTLLAPPFANNQHGKLTNFVREANSYPFTNTYTRSISSERSPSSKTPWSLHAFIMAIGGALVSTDIAQHTRAATT